MYPMPLHIHLLEAALLYPEDQGQQVNEKYACRSHKENVPDYRFSQAMSEGLQSPLRQSLFKYACLLLLPSTRLLCLTSYTLSLSTPVMP